MLTPYPPSAGCAVSKKIDYGNRQACRDCPLRSRCTNDSSARFPASKTRPCSTAWPSACKAQRPEILDRRREIVEHPFGTIKQWMNQGAFLMRGLDNVRAEFSLTALAYNFRRVLNIVGVSRLDGRAPGLKSRLEAALPLTSATFGMQRLAKSFSNLIAGLRSRNQDAGDRLISPVTPPKPPFPHGLLDFRREYTGHPCRVMAPSRAA